MGAQLVPYLGISYIGACARDAGFAVDIIDMCGEDVGQTQIVKDKYVVYGMRFSSLNKRIKPSEVIGFTCMFSQDWIFHRELIQYVRQLYPEGILVAGGEHISALPEYCLEDCPELDICVIGEGEEVFVKLLDVIKNKEDLSHVPSLVYRTSEGNSFSKTSRSGRIRDIDKIPLPAWDLIPMENYLSRELSYHISRGRTLPMIATRGCPYKCTFCSNSNMWGVPWIARKPRLVVDEMEYYINRYKAVNFVFSDLTAVVNRAGIVDLCNEIISRRIRVTWQLPTLRTEAVDYDILRLMYEAGCRDLDVAIESGSKNVLDSVGKKNNPKKIFCLIKDGVGIGMNLSSNIIVGLPEEGFREFLSTFRLVIKLAFSGLQELNVFPFVPYPGSKLFHESLSAKKITLNDSYFFNLFGYADISKAVSWSGHFGPRSLNCMRLTLLVSFYGIMFISHPKRILKLIVNGIRGKTTTKLENVLKRIIRNLTIYFSLKGKDARENT